jgi:hypothetical protein
LTAAADRICVVHLVRAANGMAPLRTFLESYARHPAGVAHELLLLCKGFGRALPDDYEQLLKDVACVRRFIPDRGFDVDAYFSLARAHDAQAYCFLNSFSVILADGWLANLHHALERHNAGMVGATGSWQSVSANYSDTLPEPPFLGAAVPAWKRMLMSWFPFLRPLRQKIWRLLMGGSFDAFPNYHLRTNALMLRRETALAVRVPPTRRKFDAYKFESGRRGLTRQILAIGKPVMVVGRDDRAYDRQDWPLSNTFWRRNQENLLVADNQTRAYDRADRNLRAAYSVIAWGPAADPAYGRERAHGA